MTERILEGKRAVVTGGSAGLGAAIAVRYAEAGASVWVAGGSNAAGMQETVDAAARAGVKAGGDLYDLSNARNAVKLVNDGIDFLGGVDILVNSAGTRNLSKIVDVEDDAIELLFEVNAKSAYYASREAARYMVGQKSGHILMIGSDAGEHGTSDFSLYSCTKTVLHNLTKCLAIELGPLGIRVNCLALGPTMSGRVKVMLENDPAFAKSRREKVPIRQFGDPVKIAETALFLVSPTNDFMNGARVMVDGGISAS